MARVACQREAGAVALVRISEAKLIASKHRGERGYRAERRSAISGAGRDEPNHPKVENVAVRATKTEVKVAPIC